MKQKIHSRPTLSCCHLITLATFVFALLSCGKSSNTYAQQTTVQCAAAGDSLWETATGFDIDDEEVISYRQIKPYSPVSGDPFEQGECTIRIDDPRHRWVSCAKRTDGKHVILFRGYDSEETIQERVRSDYNIIKGSVVETVKDSGFRRDPLPVGLWTGMCRVRR
jgi:hypothetical protein